MLEEKLAKVEEAIVQAEGYFNYVIVELDEAELIYQGRRLLPKMMVMWRQNNIIQIISEDSNTISLLMAEHWAFVCRSMGEQRSLS